MPKTILTLALLFAASMLVGCSSLGAKPYQRGTLAKDTMQLDHDAVTISFDDHIYFSKEASSGGASFGGGGCGCN